MYIEDRLFSEISGEVKYYSVAMTEEEYSLYSEFIEKTFNSKAQKILRYKYDLSKGLEVTRNRMPKISQPSSLHRNRSAKDIQTKMRKRGRLENRRSGNPVGVDASILDKSVSEGVYGKMNTNLNKEIIKATHGMPSKLI